MKRVRGLRSGEGIMKRGEDCEAGEEGEEWQMRQELILNRRFLIRSIPTEEVIEE
jgi:hypothetical protein